MHRCSETCDLVVRPGGYEVALSEGTSDPIVAVPRTQVKTPVEIQGVYDSSTGARQAGWITLGVGVPISLSGLGAGIAMATNDQLDNAARNVGAATAVGAGLSLAAVLVVGIILSTRGDDATAWTQLLHDTR